MHGLYYGATFLSQPPKNSIYASYEFRVCHWISKIFNGTTTLPQPESAAMPKTSASMKPQEGKGTENQLAVGDTPQVISQLLL